VSSAGLVTAGNKGTAKVTAGLNGLSATASVTVGKNGGGKPHFVSGASSLTLTLAADADGHPAVILTLSGVPGTLCELQATTNLVDWVTIHEVTLSDAPTSLIDPEAGSSAARFYRVQSGGTLE
jgi:hypothetical protein